jgi:hypothetical protein
VRAGDATGNHRIEVVGRDQADNESKAVAVTLAVGTTGTPPLAVAGVAPLSGGAGTPITISGTGFIALPEATVVMVGGKRATVVSATSTRLGIRIPAGAASGPVTVTNRRGSVLSAATVAVDRGIAIEAFGRRSVAPGDRLRLAARTTGLGAAPITWSVNGIPGGSAAVGTIDASGVYVAPVAPPTGGSITIGASAGSSTQSTSGTVTIQVTDPCAGSGTAEVQPGTPSVVVDPLGLIRIAFIPGTVTTTTTVTATSLGLAGLTMPSGYRALRHFSLAAQPRTPDLSRPARLSVSLPSWREPGTALSLYSRGASGTLSYLTRITADASGLRAAGAIRVLGDLVLAEDSRVAPGWNRIAMRISGVRVPTELDQDPGSGSAIKEGATLPVLIEGNGFSGGQVEVEVASGTVESGSGSRAATAAELATITLTGVMVGSTGNQVGFTLRSDAIPTLNPGELLRLVFAVHRFAGTTTPAESLVTSPTAFAIQGLAELIVDPRPEAQRDLFATDGTPIDALVSETGRTYSKIHVRHGATLGIGRALGSARLPIGANGALMEVDLSSLARFQDVYGGLPWAAGKPVSSRIFVPFREHVETDVVGTVQIDGTVYLAGMRGGENHELRPVDPSLPEDERQELKMQNARRAAYGALSATLGDAYAYMSGGVGGDGGQTSGSGESIQVGDGNPAGNGIGGAGLGRRPVRTPSGVQSEAYANAVAALGGKGVHLGTEPLLGFMNGVIEVRGCQVKCVTFSHLHPLPKQHDELIEGGFPLWNGLGPLFGHVLQPHVQQFDNGLVIGERAAAFQHLPQRIVQRFNGVRRIDGTPDRRWIVKEHRQAIPVSEPARADGGVLGVPAVGEALQGLLRSREGRGTIDGSQVRRHGPALFPGHIFETIAHLMDNTQLHLRVRKHRLNRLRQSLQPVDARNKAVGDSAILQLREHRQPEFRPLALAEPQPQEFLLPVHSDPQREVHRLRLHRPLFPRFHK